MRGAAFGLLLLGCHGTDTFTLPAVEGAQTAVLVTADRAAGLGVLELSGDRPTATPRLALRDDDRVVVLYYAFQARALGLNPGLFHPPPAGPRVTSPLQAYRFHAGVDGPLELPTPSEVEAAEDRVRAMPPSFDACVEDDGCLARAEDQATCTSACGEADLVDPLMPALVCPADWVKETELVLGLAPCHPPVPAAIGCPVGQWQGHGAADCGPIGPACSSRFPRLPGAGLYVDPAAAPGGDGSEAAPFATIAEALAVAGRDGVLGLAQGDYAGPITLEHGQVRLVGACTEGTRLVGADAPVVEVRSGVAQLSDLTIERTDPGVAVRAEGRLDLDRVETGALSLSAGGTLRGTVVRAQGAPALLLEGGRAQLNRVGLRAPGEAGLVLEFGSVDAADVVIDAAQGVRQRPGTQLLAARLWIRGAESVGLQIGDDLLPGAEGCGPVRTATTVLDEAWISEPGPDASGLVALCGAGVRFDRLGLFGHSQVALAAIGARVVGRGAVILDAPVHPGPFSVAIGSGASAELDFIRIRSSAARLVDASGEQTVLRVGDALLEGLGPRDRAFSSRGPTVGIHKLWVAGEGDVTLRSDAEVTLSDLRLAGTGALRVSAPSGAALDRISILHEPEAELGVELGGCAVSELCGAQGVALRDLAIQGGKVGLRVTMPLPESEVTRFRLQGLWVSALELPFPVPLDFREGLIADSEVVVTRGGDDPLSERFISVQFRGNGAGERRTVP